MNANQLRASLLQMAIEGKLVPQLEIEPVVEALGEEPEDVPFAIPEKWKWVRLELVCEYIQRGKSPKYSEIRKYPVISQKCNQWDGFHIEKAKFIDPQSITTYKQERLLQNLDVMWNSTGLGTLGRLAVYETNLNPYEIAVADSHVTIIRTNKIFLYPWFLYWFLRNPSVQNVIEDLATGSTKQKELSTNTIKNYLVPLPPLEEQYRIVNKLDELFPLVNDYGKAQDLLDQLNAGIGSKLKASLLQEAIQGRLVPQLETESAVEAFADEPEDVPFAIPEKWKWIKMNHVVELFRGVTFPASAKHLTFASGLVRCLTTGSVQQTHRTSSDVFIDKSFVKKDDRYLKRGDIVISTANSRELVGKSFMWDQDAEATFGGFLTVARCKTLIIPKYLSLIFSAFFHLGIFKEIATQTINIANLNNKQLLALDVPLPPREEQLRIVEKLELLLVEVDKLVR